MKLRRWLKWIGLSLGGLVALGVVVCVIAAVWVMGRLDGSLPLLEGQARLPELSNEVLVERDDHGVPTIRASSRLDVARATGFVHSQDRFFQMDLLRRRAAGELAEIIGPPVVELDRSARVHRFRALARRAYERLEPESRAIIDAYTEGVAAGLAALRHPPVEYLLLQAEPAPWRVEDSMLAVYAMYIDLQDETGSYESTLGLMRDLLPEAVYAFLAPHGTEWDAPLVGGPLALPPVPTAGVFDLRGASTPAGAGAALDADAVGLDLHVGSNSWAVAGTHTADGGALLANDMHLPLAMPNIWYRASFVWTDEADDAWSVTGVTLPGAPLLVVGSNGFVAWGFTNTEMDLSDLVVLETEASGYRTDGGVRPFERYEERIRVKGAEDVLLEVLWTQWGPVVDEDHLGRRRALHWVAHEEAAADLGLLQLERVRNLDEAVDAATRTGIPTQNFVAVDSDGRVGWTLMGPLPRRNGYAGRVPGPWHEARTWTGLLEPTEYPRIVDPRSGRIWTANNRVLDGAGTERLGGGSYGLGARARQIRDSLFEIAGATPETMLALQLDDRAILLERWRGLLLEVLNAAALEADPRRGDLRRVVADDWSGRASIDSAGYRMVRAYRLFLADRVFPALTAACVEADEGFSIRRTLQWEGPLWRMVEQRPLHLLSTEYASWDALLLAAADAVLERFPDGDEEGLGSRTWGRRNTVRIRHPLSWGLPPSLGFIADRLDVLPEPLPGDSYMPRVQGLGHGASERLVVSPGREDQGLFHMPGGQSGHPISPFYRKGHEAWAEGKPTPFLPGPTAHRLKLVR